MLYDSINKLIAPETLQDLTGETVTTVCCTPMTGGLSGSRLLVVEAAGDRAHRFILKHMSAQADWLMQSSNDHTYRSVALWRHGLLDQLAPTIDHAILACARDGDGWAMLMYDVSPNLMDQAIWSEKNVKLGLDVLVVIHATFWEAPTLANPALNLCDTAGMIQAFSVDTARNLPSNTSPIPQMVIEGWELLQEWLAPDVADILANLIMDPYPLQQALNRYPTTLVHGDYKDMHLALKQPDVPQMTVLDWQLAACSAPTVDLAWFLTRPLIYRSSLAFDAAVDYYRRRLEQHLGTPFSSEQWQGMLALGLLVDILRVNVFRAWFATNSDNPLSNTVDRTWLSLCNDQVRAASQWL